MEETMC